MRNARTSAGECWDGMACSQHSQELLPLLLFMRGASRLLHLAKHLLPTHACDRGQSKRACVRASAATLTRFGHCAPVRSIAWSLFGLREHVVALP